jgi:hypothetical protein
LFVCDARVPHAPHAAIAAYLGADDYARLERVALRNNN